MNPNDAKELGVLAGQQYAALPVQRDAEPVASDWRLAAAQFLRDEAAQQQASNEKWPRHAEAYPEWTKRIDWAIRMAEKLEGLAECFPYGLDDHAAPLAQRDAERDSMLLQLANAALHLNTGWNNKETESLIGQRIDLLRRLANSALSGQRE